MRNLLLIELDDVELAQLRAIASINNAKPEEAAAKLLSERIVEFIDAEVDAMLGGK